MNTNPTETTEVRQRDLPDHAEERCPECGDLGGHSPVHVRHETGGGGVNRPCSRTQQDDDRPSWIDEHGSVDLDAVRSGAIDPADAPAVLESLTDEVERLREDRAAADDTIRGLDARASEQATRASQYRELLAAVLAAVDLPAPSAVGGRDAHDSLLSSQAGWVRSAVEVALEDDYNVPVMTRSLRDKTADAYRTAGGGAK